MCVSDVIKARCCDDGKRVQIQGRDPSMHQFLQPFAQPINYKPIFSPNIFAPREGPLSLQHHSSVRAVSLIVTQHMFTV